MRFVHTADWQLGSTRRWLDPGAAARLAEARTGAILRTGALAADAGAAFVLVCGDVFEHDAVPASVVQQTLDALAEVPVPVHLVPGNHDPAGPGGLWSRDDLTGRLPAHVHVHLDPTPVRVTEDLELVPVPWPSKAPGRDLVAAVLDSLAPPPPGVARVLAAHGAVDPALSAGRRTDIDLARLESALADDLVHYAALGDHHAPAQVGDTGRIRYPGTPEPTDWRDASPGRVLLVDVQPGPGRAVGVEVTEHAIGTWAFTSLEPHLTSEHDVVRLAQHLDRLPDKRTLAVRLTLGGALTPPARAALDHVLERASARLAALVVRDAGLVSTPSLADLTDARSLGLDYVGFVDDAVAELVRRHRSGASPSGSVPVVAEAEADLRAPVLVPALDAPQDVATGARDAEAAGDALVLLHTWAGAGDRA